MIKYKLVWITLEIRAYLNKKEHHVLSFIFKNLGKIELQLLNMFSETVEPNMLLKKADEFGIKIQNFYKTIIFPKSHS